VKTRSADLVTFTLSLPRSCMFDETVEALKMARDLQMHLGNPEAAQALHTVAVLADAGRVAFMTTTTPTILKSQG
jgi:hypothetical protein